MKGEDTMRQGRAKNPSKFLRLAYLGVIAVGGLAGWSAMATTGQVAFPFDYARRFFIYNRIEHPNQSPPVVRILYVNKETKDSSEPGKPVPYKTLLVMEERKALVDTATGKAILDVYGRMRMTDEISNVFVMAKRPGLGASYPPAKRNGEWEYAWFSADGTRVQGKSMDDCFACHKNREASDFNFTFSKWVLDSKKR
jgi:hypothetical protein